MLVTPDGRRYWPFFGVTLYRQIAPLTQYQFVHTSRDVIEARLVVERPLTEAEQAALRARIHTTLPYPFRIEFNLVAEIPRRPGGKTRISSHRSEIEGHAESRQLARSR